MKCVTPWLIVRGMDSKSEGVRRGFGSEKKEGRLPDRPRSKPVASRGP